MGSFQHEVFPAGTPMQQRNPVRTTPCKGEARQGSPEFNEVLATLKAVGQAEVIEQINLKLRDGFKVELDFKPNPGGSLTYKFSKGGTSGSGSCPF